MIRPALPLVLLVASCNATHNPVTGAGTVLIDWDNTKATRPGIRTATVGPHTSEDYTVVSAHEGAPPITFDLHVELATVDYDEGKTHEHHTTPVVIKVTVKDNPGWDLRGTCDEGPNYPMGPVDSTGRMAAPLAMMQDCTLHEHRLAGVVFKSSWGVGFSLEVFGDGTIRPFPPEGVTVTPR